VVSPRELEAPMEIRGFGRLFDDREPDDNTTKEG
jgi:hypothetical protein